MAQHVTHLLDRWGNTLSRIHVPKDDSEPLVVERAENVSAVLDEAKRVREEHEGRWHKRELLRPVAEVPASVVEQAMREGWFKDQKKWKQWMNNPDNKAFRIWGGRV